MSHSRYRSKIYASYASRFQDAGDEFEARAAEAWGRPYDRYLRGWLPTDRNAAIIDVACGGGRALFFLKRRGYTRVEGIDISPEQVHLARQVLSAVSVGNVTDYLSSRHESFDLAIGLDFIEHLQKDEILRFLEVSFGSLRMGGMLILQTPNADSPFVASSRYNDLTHETCFNPNSLGRLMRLCGYTLVEAREAGPVPHGLVSSLRWLTWQAIRQGLRLYNLAEMGTIGSDVFTRNFLIAGRRG